MQVQTRGGEVTELKFSVVIGICSAVLLGFIFTPIWARSLETQYTVCKDSSSAFDNREELADKDWNRLFGVSSQEIAPGQYVIDRTWYGKPVAVLDQQPVAC